MKNKKIIIFLAIILLTLLIPVIINESYKHDMGYKTIWGVEAALSFYGSYLSFFGTFSLGYLVYVNNRESQIDKYIINGKKLCYLLDTVDKQLYQFEKSGSDSFIHINYDHNWKTYFFEFRKLKFNFSDDYLDVLNNKFETIDLINQKISSSQYTAARKILMNYEASQEIYMGNFNIVETKMNLCMKTFSNNYTSNDIPWLYKDNLNKTMEDYSERYVKLIEEWLYTYLINSKKDKLKYGVIEYQLIDWLLDKPEFKKLYSTPYDKRIINRIIFLSSLKLKTNKKYRVSFVWGEYYLNE